MKPIRISIRLWLLLLLTLSACGVTPVTAVETATPDAVMTALVQTLTVAAAPTKIPPPSATSLPPTRIPSSTPVPFPTITPIPSFTPQPSFTPFGTPPPTSDVTLTPGDGTDTGPTKEFACKLVTKSPENWTTMKPRQDFNASWTVQNTGKKIWHFGGVVIEYIEGSKFYQDLRTKQKIFNLSGDVDPGEETVLMVDMAAPKNKGNHTATWGLMEVKSKQVFCTFTVMITVK
jgi:hypothetical protein